MKIYHYDRATGIYIGESQARLDPLETLRQKTNVYLLPAYATFTAPPVIPEGKQAAFISGKWVLEDIPKPPEPEKPPEPTEEEIKALELETKIQAELRAMAIERLQAKGEIIEASTK